MRHLLEASLLVCALALPAAAPGIFVGLRTALGQAWMAVVASEIFGVPGLGQRMMQAASDIFLGWIRNPQGLDGEARDFKRVYRKQAS